MTERGALVGAAGQVDWERAGVEAAALTARLVRVPSVAGQARETEAARLLAAEAVAAGLRTRLYEPVPGAGSLVAELPGESAESLLLLAHLDVAPPGPDEAWAVGPFAGEIHGSSVWGRGAVDAKGLAAVWLTIMRLAAGLSHRKYGLVLAATAGEEGGPHNGLSSLLEQGHLRTCRWALGEGGGMHLRIGSRSLVFVQTGEKGLLRVRVPAGARLRSPDGRVHSPGHPERDLLREAFAEARGWPRRLGRLLPASLLQGSERPSVSLVDHESDTWQYDVQTRVMTVRICPGTNSRQVQVYLAREWGTAPEQVEVLERIEATSSEPHGPLYDAVQAGVRAAMPGALVAPFWTPGRSDNGRTRARSIPTYGFFCLPAEEVIRQHCPNERIAVRSLEEAVRVGFGVVSGFLTGKW